MAGKDKIRYLVALKGAAGQPPRYFWMPSPLLRAAGHSARRVPENWRDHADPAALYAAAAAAAIALNRAVDAARAVPAVAQLRSPPARDVNALIKAYKASDSYKNLRPKTRLEYDKCLARIADYCGECPVRAIDRLRVDRFKFKMRATPAQSNAVIRVLRLLLAFGLRNPAPGGAPWLTFNPASQPGLTATQPSGRIWPRAAVALMVETADRLGLRSIGTAIVLDEWLGQREADILRMPRTVYRDGKLVFRQAKGRSIARGSEGAGIVLTVEDVPHLVARLSDELARQDARHKALAAANPRHVVPLNIIQSEETGRAYIADNFRHCFARVRAAAERHLLAQAGWREVVGGGWVNDAVTAAVKALPAKERRAAIEAARRDAASFDIDYLLPGREMEDGNAFRLHIGDLQFMHLRHTAITRLAEAQVTKEWIAAVSGHSLKTIDQILERYMIRTAAMARTAFAMRREHEGG